MSTGDRGNLVNIVPGTYECIVHTVVHTVVHSRGCRALVTHS